METKLEKEVRFLKSYAIVMTLVFGVFIVSGFTLQNRKQKFEEIDVNRINVVEKDGATTKYAESVRKFQPRVCFETLG